MNQNKLRYFSNIIRKDWLNNKLTGYIFASSSIFIVSCNNSNIDNNICVYFDQNKGNVTINNKIFDDEKVKDAIDGYNTLISECNKYKERKFSDIEPHLKKTIDLIQYCLDMEVLDEAKNIVENTTEQIVENTKIIEKPSKQNNSDIDKIINILRFFKILTDSKKWGSISEWDYRWIKENQEKLVDLTYLEKNVLEKYIKEIDKYTNDELTKEYDNLMKSFDADKKKFNNAKEMFDHFWKNKCINDILRDIGKKSIEIKDDDTVILKDEHEQEINFKSFYVSDITSFFRNYYNLSYEQENRLWDYFNKKGTNLGYDYFFDDNGDINNSTKVEIQKVIGDHKNIKDVKLPNIDVFAFENIDKELEYLKKAIGIIKKLIDTKKLDKAKNIIEKIKTGLSFFSEAHMGYFHLLNFFEILSRSGYEIHENDKKWINNNRENLKKYLCNILNVDDNSAEQYIKKCCEDNAKTFINLEEKIDYNKIFNTEPWDKIQMIYKEKNINIEKQDLFPFLIERCGGASPIDVKQIQFYTKCYENDNNFIEYLRKIQILNFIEETQRDINTKFDANRSKFIEKAQYAIKINFDARFFYDFFYHFKTTIREFLFSSDKDSDQVIKIIKDAFSSLFKKYSDQDIKRIKDKLSKLKTKSSELQKDFDDFIQELEKDFENFITELGNKLKNINGNISDTDKEKLGTISNLIEGSILKGILKKDKDYFSSRIAMDNERVILENCKFLEIFYKKNETKYKDKYNSFDKFLAEETSFFDKDDYKDYFANEPNKKNILLFSIAKRLYNEKEGNPEYQSNVDELIKYIIKHASKEMLMETDMNGFNALHIAVIKKEEDYINLILKRAEELKCKEELIKKRTNKNFKFYIKNEYLEAINFLSKLGLKVHRGLYEPKEYTRITDILLDKNSNNRDVVCNKNYKDLQNINDDAREFVLYSIYPVDFSCYRQNIILKK